MRLVAIRGSELIVLNTTASIAIHSRMIRMRDGRSDLYSAIICELALSAGFMRRQTCPNQDRLKVFRAYVFWSLTGEMYVGSLAEY